MLEWVAQVNDAILYMLVDSAEKLKFMTVLDFPNNNITDESIGELTNSRENSKMIRNVKYLSSYLYLLGQGFVSLDF